jgi:hypothetical protein
MAVVRLLQSSTSENDAYAPGIIISSTSSIRSAPS